MLNTYIHHRARGRSHTRTHRRRRRRRLTVDQIQTPHRHEPVADDVNREADEQTRAGEPQDGQGSKSQRPSQSLIAAYLALVPRSRYKLPRPRRGAEGIFEVEDESESDSDDESVDNVDCSGVDDDDDDDLGRLTHYNRLLRSLRKTPFMAELASEWGVGRRQVAARFARVSAELLAVRLGSSLETCDDGSGQGEHLGFGGKKAQGIGGKTGVTWGSVTVLQIPSRDELQRHKEKETGRRISETKVSGDVSRMGR